MFNLSQLTAKNKNQLAAIDLGSNSFHLIIAKVEDDQLLIQDKIKESVRLGFGLKRNGELTEEARIRALDCLSRFNERLQGLPPGSVRTVGTKTLRALTNAEEFIAQAENRLGHKIEIVSGEEEARLIYAGVSRNLAFDGRQRILIDIGGGSTEVIIGKDMNPQLKESLSMGCVQIMRDFFHDDQVTETRVQRALTSCFQEIEAIQDDYKEMGWEVVLGSSGSIKAVGKICEAMGYSDGTIELEHLNSLINTYLTKGDLNVELKGLSEDRRPVFLGGCIVLKALFETLGLKGMTASEWALREGLLYDLVGRLGDDDIRDTSVNSLAKRFDVNLEHTQKVKNTALNLLEQTEDATDPHCAQLLSWASDLAFTGLEISHSDYHKHSAYIVEHVEAAGFSKHEKEQLAAIVLAHRKDFPKEVLADYPEQNSRIAVLLRLAVLFNRTRLGEELPNIKIKAVDNTINLDLPSGWFQQHPLTLAYLETETKRLSEIGIELKYA